MSRPVANQAYVTCIIKDRFSNEAGSWTCYLQNWNGMSSWIKLWAPISIIMEYSPTHPALQSLCLSCWKYSYTIIKTIYTLLYHTWLSSRDIFIRVIVETNWSLFQH